MVNMEAKALHSTGYCNQQQQRMSYKKKLRLLPSLLVWLSLAAAVLRESSNDSHNKNGSSNNNNQQLTRRFLAAAADAASAEHRSSRTSPVVAAATLQTDGDLLVLNDGAVEVLDDMQEHLNHRQAQQPSDENQREDPGVIVVITVDGTMAGISRETGQLLWKHSETAASSPPTFGSLKVNHHSTQSKESAVDAGQILQPLVSTTTTTKSASTASYAVVPSVDGTVFTTYNDMTVSTSVKELVARSPFLDPRGRFYVGSRHTTAAALDVVSGEILRVISTGSNSADGQLDDFPSMKERNVVWLGRVDHTVSIQDARTGIMDAQFSVAEVMSVADMHGMARKEAWTPERLKGGHSDQNTPLPVLNEETGFDTSILPLTKMPVAVQRDGEVAATLIATPNGNIAFYDFKLDELSWVADESFDSPVAYAMDAGTGSRIEVDIIPDVVDPNGDNDYLRKEMERQLSVTARDEVTDEQTIVGAMSNGQLYALPLGLKSTFIAGSGTATSTPISSSSSAAAIASSSSTNIKHPSQVSQLPGRPSTTFHDPRHHHHRVNDKNDHAQSNVDGQSPGKHSLLTGKKPCTPSSPNFPACLVPHHSRTKLSSESAPPLGTGSISDGLANYPHSDAAVALMTSKYHKEDGGFYHPDFGYVSPEDLYRFQQRSHNKSYKKIFWLLSSWLPPTILCIFVASFELGRRKRLRDEKQQKELVPAKAGQMDGWSASSPVDAIELPQRAIQLEQKHVISVSEEVLGYGGHGTVVYKGMLDGRDVAVKRMLKAYHASADREISLLIESDGDPNVVRYFLKEVRGDFVYLALELCDLSLHDLIGVLREKHQEQFSLTNAETLEDNDKTIASTKRILLQIASGVKHLHSLRIVHRDLKPANILCAISKRGKKKDGNSILDSFVCDSYVAKISDMGLGKQLLGQSSIGASLVGESSYRGSKGLGPSSIGVGPGSVGWQAPEVMAMRLTSDMSMQSNDSTTNAHETRQNTPDDMQHNSRTSRSVDIFSLGCIFYSLLIPGSHPYGEWFEREANIMHNRPNLDALRDISFEAYDLVRSMLDRNPTMRPTAKQVCQHPFFWNRQRKLMFLCDFSDRLETENPQQMQVSLNALAIERGAVDVVGTSWEAKLDGALIFNVQKFRTYDYSCIRDLLRLIRNKHHHFDELPEDFRMSTAPNQDALFAYFEKKFPSLVMHCYEFCRTSLKDDDVLVSKYEIRPMLKLQKMTTAPTINPISVIVHDDCAVLEADEDVSKPANQVAEESLGEEPEWSIVNEAPTVDATTADMESAGFSNDSKSDDTEVAVLASPEGADIIVWEGSAAAKAFNCRGWSRSGDEWSRHIEPMYKKRDPGLKRCVEDPKFRTRLCNHWDESLGMFCSMKKKNKCIFAHGPAELRVKEGKKNRWGRLVDRNGNNSNPWHSGGEDTYGPASTIEQVRKEEGKRNRNNNKTNGVGSANKAPRKRATSQRSVLGNNTLRE